MIVCSNGLNVDVFGPEKLWAGTVSDADILKYIMPLPCFLNLFKPRDVFILERGFERAKLDLESRGFRVSTPCLKKGRQQLTTLEANTSRLCTKQRWVIEWVNASLKLFAHLRDTIPSQEVPDLNSDTRIAAAIHNCYIKRQVSDSDDPEIARKMLQNVNTPNVMQHIVEKESLIRRNKTFTKLTENHFTELQTWTHTVEHTSCH